ncbi:hypothetical protein [Flagellimonas sp.]|uniref:alpha/beta hydrolase n=1 Tax=Flagellimonas sp. TaxID=2058762 RepID=UPI003B5A2873
MIKNSILFILFTIGSTTQLIAQNGFDFYNGLHMGAHNVGTIVDSLKYTTDETNRKLHVHIWYPAKADGDKLTLANYLDPQGNLGHQELLENLSIGISGTPNAFPKDSLELLLNFKMKASKNAVAKNERFPLLVWSMRYGTVSSQSLISEYLASHGYVVAYVEDHPNAPFPWQLPSAEEKESALNQQVEDVNHAIDHLKKQPNINSNSIGMLTWSYAGESAIMTQMNNADIDLVVGLSSIGFSYGIYLGSELPKKISVGQLQVPYLILSEKIGTNGKKRTPPEIFDQMHPGSRYVSFKKLSHGNFNAMEGMLPGILNTNKVQSWSKGGQLAKLGYETICKTALSFINTVFQQSNSGSFDQRMMELSETLPLNFISVIRPIDRE